MQREVSRAILVLGREPPAEETLRQAELFDELYVVECAVPDPKERYVIDEERARAEAEARLAAIIDRLRSDGVAADGIVGDPDEETAADDAEWLFPQAGVILHNRAQPTA